MFPRNRIVCYLQFFQIWQFFQTIQFTVFRAFVVSDEQMLKPDRESKVIEVLYKVLVKTQIFQLHVWRE